MAKLAVLETEIVNIAKKIKAGIEVAGEDAVKVASFLESNSAEITSLASLAGPGAAGVSKVGITLVNLAINAVKSADSASLANGLNVNLDAATIADVKALIDAIEKI